jgi:hypothetical protein
MPLEAPVTSAVFWSRGFESVMSELLETAIVSIGGI